MTISNRSAHAMAIFSKSPAKQLADATAATAKLAQRLADAEIAVADNRKAAEELALAGADDAKLDEAEAKTRASVDRVATLKTALAQAEVAVADLERERAEQADKRQREETSVETEALARRVTEGCAKLVADAAALSDWTARAAAVVPEAGGVLNFCQIISREIPQASDLIAKLLSVHAASVIAGHAASSLPQPMEPYVPPPVAPREPETTVFCLRSIRWKDGEGQQRIAAKFTDASIPARLVGRALRIGACVGLDHASRKENRTQGGNVRLETATDLDAEEERQAVPIMASPPQLVPYDRG